MPEPKDPNGPNQLPAESTPLFAANERVTKINVAEEIKNSFLDYSMSVIISRALPDARDGLKPSQRRLLYAMFNDLNLLVMGGGRMYTEPELRGLFAEAGLQVLRLLDTGTRLSIVEGAAA